MAHHGIEYWSLAAGELRPSTPHFPLVALLLFLMERIGLGGEIVALILAALLTSIFPWVVAMFVRRFWMNLNTARAGTMLAMFSLVFLNPWIGYSGELKPDTLALILLIFGVLAIESPKKSHLILGPGLLTLALLSKQQIWVLGLVFGILLVLRYLQSPSKESFAKLMATAATPIVAAIVLYSVPGAIEYAILGHQGRDFTLELNAGYLRPSVGLAIVGVGLVALSKLKPRTHSLSTRLERLFFIAIILTWLLVGIAGALNAGGNSGNLAMGAIFLPLLLWPLVARWAKMSLLAPFIVSCFAVVAILNSMSLTSNRLSDVGLIQGLFYKDGPSSIVLDSDSQIFVLDLQAKILTLDSWSHLRAGAMKNNVPEHAIQIVEHNMPDSVVCSQGCARYFTPN